MGFSRLARYFQNAFAGRATLAETAAAGHEVELLPFPSATWLHLTPVNQSGTGSAAVTFSFDANSGPPRAGTLTIAGQTLTVNQGYIGSGLFQLTVPPTNHFQTFFPVTSL